MLHDGIGVHDSVLQQPTYGGVATRFNGGCVADSLWCALLLAAQVQDVTLAIHTLWGAPVLIVVIVGLLYQQLGWATFVGLVVVAIYSPISSECLV